MPAQRAHEPSPKRTMKLQVFIPAALAALVLPFVVGYAVAVFIIFPAPKVIGVGGIAVPDLIGHTVGEAEEMLVSANLGTLVKTELPHPDAAAGQILAQDPLPGQKLKAGRNVSVSVSSGPPLLTVPDVTGFTADAAEQILKKMGFDTQRTEAPGSSRGTVLRMEPAAGTNAKLPAMITIFVSSGSSATDTTGVPPDTIPAILQQRRPGNPFPF